MISNPYYFKDNVATYVICDPNGNTLAYVPKYVKNERKDEMKAHAKQIVSALNTQWHMQQTAKNLLAESKKSA